MPYGFALTGWGLLSCWMLGNRPKLLHQAPVVLIEPAFHDFVIVDALDGDCCNCNLLTGCSLILQTAPPLSSDLSKQPGWRTNHANSTYRSAAVDPWSRYLPSIVDTLGNLKLEDIAVVARLLPEITYGAVLLREYPWAPGLQQAAHEAGVLVFYSAYITPQTQAELLVEME